MPMTVAPAALKSNNASTVESTTITTTATATATTTATTSTAINGTATQSTIDDDPLPSPTPTTAPTTATATPDKTSADLNRSASSNDIPTLTSLSQATDHPDLRKAFSDVVLAHSTLPNDAAAAAAAQHDATSRARAQSAADITAPPKRRGSVLFNRERQKSFSNVTISRFAQPSPPSTADNKGSVKSSDSNGGDKPSKGRSFLASLARRPWRTLSSPRSTSPSPSSPTPPVQLGGSYETLHTAPNGDAPNGVPAMPAVPDDYRSFTPVPQSPVAESPKQWASSGHERRKGSVSSLKGGSASTKRPGSRGRGNSTANGSTSTAVRPSYSAPGSVSGEDEGTLKRPEAPRRNSSKSLRAKMSLERLTASKGASSASDIPPVPPTPTVSTSFTVKGFGSSISSETSAKRRDELWGAFRTLDNDLAKFRSKAGNLRTSFMRNNILSMLHRCANHPSNNNLRPEDLDRRANILNKWWTVLLEALNGGQSQLAVSNVDRPLYFEAITMIMTRPEFKYPFLPNSPKSPVNADSVTSPGGIFNETSSGPGSGSAKGPNSRSKTSLESEESDFLTESIYHNVRNILNQNLLSQLGFCIDRMSMRHCSASLVSFSARTCAYAFVCCPDVPDVLVHLWHINPDALKRVVAMYDPDRSMKERVSSSEDIASYFPPAIRSLAFTSHVAIVRWLRKRAIPPITANHINWYGPWKTRWAGGDTDLFFLFIKYYHLLIAEFVSIPQLPKSKLLYIPGLVLVNTQILKVLEKTLARSANPIQEEKTSGANGQVTFDDLIDAAETTATSPLGTANTLRQMSENRLVLLLRDIIADPQFSSELRLVFVESICDLLKTVTRKTSLFDHNACFVLMDLVQEFVSVISSYAEQVNRPDLVDWDFWLNVFVQMLQSNNSLTEVRAFAFWFMMWDSVCTNEKLRERLCMDILLDDSTFYRYFNHWSAMVRAYFHRLICWRLARYSGEATPLDQ
ncbi:hypothetical protein KEM56_001537 [Ascosphaera pollenicola]|nr:hypothetical protein KEM56_001537 [Ascosphaera pollenicola]